MLEFREIWKELYRQMFTAIDQCTQRTCRHRHTGNYQGLDEGLDEELARPEAPSQTSFSQCQKNTSIVYGISRVFSIRLIFITQIRLEQTYFYTCLYNSFAMWILVYSFLANSLPLLKPPWGPGVQGVSIIPVESLTFPPLRAH